MVPLEYSAYGNHDTLEYSFILTPKLLTFQFFYLQENDQKKNSKQCPFLDSLGKLSIFHHKYK